MEEKEQKKSSVSDSQEFTDSDLWLASAMADDSHKYNVDQAFERFKKRTGINRIGGRHFSLQSLLLMAAAAVAVLIVVSITSYRQGGKSVSNRFADIVVEAPMGAKTKLQLPDGSNVWLNAGSRIVYSQGFGVSNRNISFSGEGFFKVGKNQKLPFIIKTNEVDVKVVGTRFNFRNYDNDEEAIVELMKGKVALLNKVKKESVQYMKPSDRMVLDKKTGKMEITSTDKVKYAADWTKNILFFNEELLPDIVKKLERSYNVKIKIENKKLLKTRFYGHFNQRDYTVYDVLNRMSDTGRLKYIERDNIIYLR